MDAQVAIKLVNEMRQAQYNVVGMAYFDERSQKLEAGGWKLGIHAFRDRQTKGRRGRWLRKPRYQWKVVAYWFNTTTREQIWYYHCEALSKADAQDRAARSPMPEELYTTVQVAPPCS
jgi:hypothetical protein